MTKLRNVCHFFLFKAVKLYMDKAFGPAWHVCVGKDFGSSVTYKNRHFLYIYVANKAIMIFKH